MSNSPKDRRTFLKLLGLGAGATGAAADAMVTGAGGPANIVERPIAELAREHAEVLEAIKRLSPGAYLPDCLETRDHALYDICKYPAGMIPMPGNEFFVEPVAHNRIGTWERKSYLETNMAMACQLPAPMSMLVEKILFLFDPNNDPQDDIDFVSRYYWEFILGQKIVARGPMTRCALSGRLPDLFTVEANSRGHVRYPRRRSDVEIAADPPGFVSLRIPVNIETQQHFRFRINRPERSSADFRHFEFRKDFSFHIFLDGLGTFGVQ